MATINVNVDEKIKEQAKETLDYLGTNFTNVINMLLRQIILTESIPFEIKVPKLNAETRKAIEDAEKGIGLSKGYTNLFKKDYKLMKKRGLNLKLLQEVVDMLANEQALPEKYKDHYLAGEYKRIQRMSYTTWLDLIYKIDKGELVLTAYRTGSHSDLF